jgi:hypothetical protein
LLYNRLYSIIISRRITPKDILKGENTMKTKLIIEHYKIVKKGDYRVARRILQILRTGNINLDLSDTDWKVEKILEKCGLKMGRVSKYGCVEYIMGGF